MVLLPDHDVLHLLAESQTLGVLDEGADGRALRLVVEELLQLAVLLVLALLVFSEEIGVSFLLLEAAQRDAGILSLSKQVLSLVVDGSLQSSDGGESPAKVRLHAGGQLVLDVVRFSCIPLASARFSNKKKGLRLANCTALADGLLSVSLQFS